jgi:tRNA dimethylallyltransferase
MVNRIEATPTTNYQPPTTIFIVGPTASGKSSLAMELARRIDGEIVCADSQTIRRALDIGTAKPTKRDQAEIKHHMIDTIGPYDNYSVNQFKSEATKAIKEIQSRNKTPIIVGGTGLYINSLFFDYEVEEISSDSIEHKQKLENMSVAELQKIILENGYDMPVNKENPRHLIGTILRAGKSPVSTEPIPGAKIFGLLPGDETLRSRINDRVEQMFAGGFVDEVESLIKTYGRPKQRMDAIGYPLVMRFLDGDTSLEEATELFKTAHWQYARRQKSWFKTNPYITWLNNDSDVIDTILGEVKSY